LDRKFRGEKVNTVVYIFYGEFGFFDGTIEVFEGDITVY